MEINSCGVINKHFCIWEEKDCFFVEDMSLRAVLPIQLPHLVWFEEALVDPLQLPIQLSFLRQTRTPGENCRIQKLESPFSCEVGCTVWPTSSGRTRIFVPIGHGPSIRGRFRKFQNSRKKRQKKKTTSFSFSLMITLNHTL